MSRLPASAQLRLPLVALLFSLVVRTAVAEDDSKGQAVYLKQCASCHGKAGEGAEDYPHALVGDKSVKELAKYIAKTMPEDDPGTCVGEDADQVASYIHDAFYSSVAQARNKPARIELSRLTVRQHQNALADLIGGFRGSMEWEGPKGLQGDYFRTQRSRDEDRLVSRVDPSVQFDFGVNLPDSDEIGHRFFIKWQGGVLAPDTGDYEFVVRTEHSVKLWVNDTEKPLIDRWVKSGNDAEYHETIRLIGGRVYPIRMEMAKGKQGVNDDKKKGPPPPTPASIALLWKRPKGVVETISSRYLSPARTPEVFVLHTSFPPDDRSMGYERGTSVSRAWDEAATDAALETAGYVASRLDRLAGTRPDASDREEKIRAFCKTFVERAFRRPVPEDRMQAYVDRRFGPGIDLDTSVKRVVLATLMSPAFLYHEVSGSEDQYDVASRLSFGLWDSAPDRELLTAASKGELKSRGQAAKQAERMVNDLRTRAKLRDFLLQWLRVDRVADLSKDPNAFPEFDEAAASDLRTSLEMFLDDVVWSGGSDFRRFLQSDELFLNGRLAKLYGASLPPDAPFQKIKLGDEPRAGLLTHPYLMASFAYTSTSSPIHRGVFLARGLLGRSLAPPPEAVAPLAPDLHAGLTTRERVELQTSPKQCRMCHDMINSVGFTLENYDALGRFRKDENGKPIDPSGTYQATSGESIVLSGPRELAKYLVEAEETRTAFAQQLFHNLVKQPVNAFGPDELKKLSTTFEKADYDVRKLMIEMMADAATAPRRPAEKTVASTP